MSFYKAFSLLELILVLFIISLLASIALPYFHFAKEDAALLRLKADFTTIQSALAYHKNLSQQIQISRLDEAQLFSANEPLFYCPTSSIQACKNANCCHTSLLQSPINSSFKGWIKTDTLSYRFYLSSKIFIDFKYNIDTMNFECLNSELCKELL